MDLKQEELGRCIKTGRLLVFYKELPSVVLEKEEELAKYKVSLETYVQLFKKNDDLVTKCQVEKIIGNHTDPTKLNEEGYSLPI